MVFLLIGFHQTGATISVSGVIKRAATDKTVKLTATLSKGSAKEDKIFDVKVLAATTSAEQLLKEHYAATLAVAWICNYCES